MAFSISPSIRIREIDATIAPTAVSTTEAAIAGVFRWGPVMERVRISSETVLEDVFFRPSDFNGETWLCSASFLAYSSTLYAVRVVSDDAANAGVGQLILDRETAETLSHAPFIGRYPGELGNNLTVSAVGPDSFQSTVEWIWAERGSNVATCYDASANSVQIGDMLILGDRRSGQQQLRVLNKTTASGTTPSASVDARQNKVLSVESGPATGQVTFKTYGPHGYRVGDFVLLNGTSPIVSSPITTEIVAANASQFTVAESVSQSNIDAFVAGTITATRVVDPSWTSGTSVTVTTFTLSGKINLPRDITGDKATRMWGYASSVGGAPVGDQIHVVVVDNSGAISGVEGTVLETYNGVSTTPGSKLNDGTNNYFKEVINGRSKWIYVTAVDPAVSSGPVYLPLTNGSDGDDEFNIPVGRIAEGYDLFAAAEEVDLSIIITGRNSDSTLANYIVNNVVLQRNDVVVTISPPKEAVLNNRGNEVNSILEFRSGVISSSYWIMDTGYKYMYDKYNDVFRWVPLNGDIAGLCAIAQPWDSPAGDAGLIRNAYGLAFNPTSKFDRDALYARDVNPVMTKTGQGTMLYGDKTGLGQNSAFSRINVRRLFIFVEKMVANFAQSLMFKNNNAFTQTRFRNAIEPKLRDIQGQGGMTSFKVVSDTSINTPSVIDDWTFRGDVYIKPPRSINFIDLRFVGTPTGMEYEELQSQLG